MCGIAGFVGRGGQDEIGAMTAALAHRGPDAEAVSIDAGSGVHLGHRRLAIIDIAGGAQPMWTADRGAGIVFNGEIYNFRELREELIALGRPFTTDHSDTEVLLQAYLQWGEECVSRLNGMWAFVIHDRARKRLFGSRDRFGKKPLYYVDRAGFFAFASELTALTAHPAVPREVSPLALAKYFAYGYVPAPLTMLSEARKLPGGCSFEYDLESMRLRSWRYWDFVLEPEGEATGDRVALWCEELRALLAQAVRRRLIADVPIGAFVSGGIDSSAVAAYAAQSLGRGNLDTYSIGFDEPSFDESAPARRIAEHVGSRHHERRLSLDVARNLVPAVLGRLDEPMADSSILPTYLLAGFAREQVTVALGGDGADELFAGYDPFRALRWARLYSRVVPRPVHRAIALVAARMPVSHRNMSLDFRVKRTLAGLDFPPRLWGPAWMAPVAPADLERCTGTRFELEEVYSEAIGLWEQDGAKAEVDKLLRFYTRLYLQDDILCKVDRASMMHSLEVRSPFLDADLVDFVRRLPANVKLRGGRTKWILRKALEPVLPRDVLERPKKGFGIPAARWFASGALAAPRADGKLVARDFLEERLQRHMTGRSDERAFLWSALVLDQFSARAAPGSSSAR